MTSKSLVAFGTDPLVITPKDITCPNGKLFEAEKSVADELALPSKGIEVFMGLDTLGGDIQTLPHRSF